MSSWSPAAYGDPCRQCGFGWSIDFAAGVAIVEATPRRMRNLLDGAAGDERHADLEWSVGAYVCHVSDNLRIWAERIAGITLGAAQVVDSYDENELARARGYSSISLEGALWSLERSVRDWLEAINEAAAELVMHHPERGHIGLLDIVRSNAHDATHHAWDIGRTLTPNRSPS